MQNELENFSTIVFKQKVSIYNIKKLMKYTLEHRKTHTDCCINVKLKIVTAQVCGLWIGSAQVSLQ